MAIERTFSILKPDVTRRNLTGAVNAAIEKAGLRIVAQKRIRMTPQQAETFYAVHKARPFFGELVETMTSGPVVVQVLEGEDAIKKYRDVLGATDPAKAAPARFARNLLSRSGKIRRMGPMRPRRRRSKSRSSFPAMRSSVRPRQPARSIANAYGPNWAGLPCWREPLSAGPFMPNSNAFLPHRADQNRDRRNGRIGPGDR